MVYSRNKCIPAILEDVKSGYTAVGGSSSNLIPKLKNSLESSVDVFREIMKLNKEEPLPKITFAAHRLKAAKEKASPLA